MKNHKTPSISVVIPNFEGESILKQIFPGQFEIISKYKGDWEVIVADDKSSDGSVSWLKSYSSRVQVVVLPKHQGFGAACNAGASQAKHEILFFLNNDMEVTEKTFSEAVPYFQDPDLFGLRLGLMMLVHKKEPIDLNRFAMGLSFERGFFELPMLRREFSEEGIEIPALSGGACAIRRDRFHELGGFDPLYLPAYWEDVDLSFRAWLRGWKILFVPQAVCFHHGSLTTKRIFTPLELKTMSEAHRYFLVWKFLRGGKRWSLHLAHLVKKLFFSLFSGKFFYIQAFFQALTRVQEVKEKRKEIQTNGGRSFELFLKKWEDFSRKYPLFFDVLN